ncbi:MAG: methyltransferase domain-containing protein [Cyanobacteria bacterium P01_D01_bin.73]
MATILRDLSYRYQWLYDGVSRLATLAVGGESRFRRLATVGIPETPGLRVLDLCCGSGQTTSVWVERGAAVTGLDASPRSLTRAKVNVPEAEYVQGFAEEMPLVENTFQVVHSSAAFHEMTQDQLRSIVQEALRVLEPGGVLTVVDFHRPDPSWLGRLMWPGLMVFMALFETETSWAFIDTDLAQLCRSVGFKSAEQTLYAGGSVQVVQAIA